MTGVATTPPTPSTPPTRLAPRTPREWLLWGAITLLGAGALGVVALSRGEPVNALWIVTAALCTYLVAYRFYGLFIATRVAQVDPARQGQGLGSVLAQAVYEDLRRRGVAAVPTWRGRTEVAVSAAPSWPKLLMPQHHRVPSSLTPQVKLPPVAIRAHPVPTTWVGLIRNVVVPSPSWPKSLRPWHQAVLSARTAQEDCPPAAAPLEGSRTTTVNTPLFAVVTGETPATV